GGEPALDAERCAIPDAAAMSARARALLELVLQRTAAVAGHPAAHSLDAQLDWRQLGIYRQRASELRARLSEALGQALPATCFFDHPTPVALARQLARELYGERGPATSVAPESVALLDDP